MKSIQDLEVTAQELDYKIKTMKFLMSLGTAKGGDVEVAIGDVKITINSDEIDSFKDSLATLLEARLQ